jgi:uncharacterized protein (DUF885 family)
LEKDPAQNWLDQFFASYYRLRPVNATFIGMHDYDGELPDYSSEGVAELRNVAEQLLETNVDTQDIDHLLAKNFLEIQLAELEARQFQKGNPAVYSSEATFGFISLVLRDFAPREQRIESLLKRMGRVPELLRQGKENVKSSPRQWVLESMRQCEGASKFLDGGIRELISEWKITSARLSEQSLVALKAFQDYKVFLSQELLPKSDENYGCGGEMFDLLLKKGHCLPDMDLEKFVSYARERFSEQKELLRSETKKVRPDGNWETVVQELSKHHPTADSILNSCEECWQDCRRIAVAGDLVNWPDYPIKYRFIPKHFKDAAPYLYFLFYRSPAAFDKIPVNDYLITPLDPSASSQAEIEEKLRALNYSVIKQNHVVHHGAIGHHVQNYYAYRGRSRIGQIAGVDCASRIAMFCGGTMTEGWATYSTALMDEAGFYSPEEHVMELHSQMRLASRAVVDYNLHAGRFSFQDAVDYYVNEVGMPLPAAQKEVVKNSMFPATGAMYIIGLDGIFGLRSKVGKRDGLNLNLRKFHSSLLSFGSIPVPIIASQLLGN